MDPGQNDPNLEIALKHSWDWFALHANQRMTTWNFYLISTAFLVAAYGALIDKNAIAAGVIGLVGAFLALCFYWLDTRTKELIEAGEAALEACENQLEKSTRIAQVLIIGAIRIPKSKHRYSSVFHIIELCFGVTFLGGSIYALQKGPTLSDFANTQPWIISQLVVAAGFAILGAVLTLFRRNDLTERLAAYFNTLGIGMTASASIKAFAVDKPHPDPSLTTWANIILILTALAILAGFIVSLIEEKQKPAPPSPSNTAKSERA